MALSIETARQLATTTKTRPMWSGISPRWLLKAMPLVDLEGGAYRVNRVVTKAVISAEHEPGAELPSTYVDFEEDAPEYFLSPLQTVVRVHTQVMDVYNSPHNQLDEQLRLTIEALYEEEENRYVNSPQFGLLANVAPAMTFEAAAPTPDDMDRLLGLVWKKPAFFLMHPKAQTRFGWECTARGVCIGTVEMFGSPFWTWRGVPILPSDKVTVDAAGRSHVLLMRVGEAEQGVVGLHKMTLPGETVAPGVSVRLTHIDLHGQAHFILTRYISLAVTASDALGVMSIAV